MLNRVGPDQGTHSPNDRGVTPPTTTRPGQWMDKPPGVREIHHYGPGPGRPRPNVHPPVSEQAAPVSHRISAGSLVLAGVLIAIGILGGIWVVYDAQYQFALLHNHDNETAAHIQAAVPELVWIAMALLGLSQALRGRKSARVTTHILLFFSLSIGAQLMYAMPNPGGYLVAIITPLALAIMLETFIDGVYRWARARDGEPVEERSILATVGKVLRRIPTLFWLLPTALLLGFVLDFQGTVEGTRSVLLAVIPWAPAAVLLAYPVAWLVRCFLDKDSTQKGLADWLKDHIPYAPGRTKVQDDARAARENAERAEYKLKTAEQMASDMVRKAEKDRDAQLDRMEREHTGALEELRREFAERADAAEREAARREEHQRAEYERQVAELSAQLRAVREGSTTDLSQMRRNHEQQLHALKGEFQRQQEGERAAVSEKLEALQAEHRREVGQLTERARVLGQTLRASDTTVEELRDRVAQMRQAASGRDRLIWAYEELQRRGDRRFGDRGEVRSVVRELLEDDPSIGLHSLNTAVNYVNLFLDENPRGRLNGATLVGMS